MRNKRAGEEQAGARNKRGGAGTRARNNCEEQERGTSRDEEQVGGDVTEAMNKGARCHGSDEPLSLEGVSQMACILPERLLALVRPAFDLVLRRIRSLKRCVQACGCKIETPRYALQFGSRLHFKRCQALPKETPFPFFGDQCSTDEC